MIGSIAVCPMMVSNNSHIRNHNNPWNRRTREHFSVELNLQLAHSLATQTPESTLGMYVSLGSIFNSMLGQCCARGLVMFRHKKPLSYGSVKVSFWMKILGFVATNTARIWWGLLENIHRCHAYKYWKAVLSCNMTVSSYKCNMNVIWHIL